MQTISTEQGESRQGGEQATTDASHECPQRSGASPTLLEHLLPEADIVMNHAIVVMAPPEVTYATLKRVDFARSRSLLLRAVFALRLAAVRRARRRLRLAPLPARVRMSLQNIEDYGQSKLAEKEGSEIVIGSIARLFSMESLFTRRTAAEFKSFDCAGHFKAAASFVVMPYGQRRTLLAYETRIRATDTRTRRRLFLLDALTAPLGRLVMRRMLRVVARVAKYQCAVPAHHHRQQAM
ncbi:hypothetical protein sce3686 [Sorangium cellulosum So ce56]|uniref:Uncharacterized protein n=2 Tax=Sorangium TaxID=39643 RepID=A9GVV2_SORC5|nr:hypothetical protein [Sorangium cellulosum]CAN93846.1 hypothetical protein sce3686 [Sorangium cellulosum So ce56]